MYERHWECCLNLDDYSQRREQSRREKRKKKNRVTVNHLETISMIWISPTVSVTVRETWSTVERVWLGGWSRIYLKTVSLAPGISPGSALDTSDGLTRSIIHRPPSGPFIRSIWRVSWFFQTSENSSRSRVVVGKRVAETVNATKANAETHAVIASRRHGF